MNPSWIALLAGLASVVPAALVAQSRFRADVDLVSMAVTIAGEKGQLVTDLEQQDFEIYEDGQRQSVQYFARGSESGTSIPLHLAPLFDTTAHGAGHSFSRTVGVNSERMPHPDMTSSILTPRSGCRATHR